ncbi:MAG: hypothetical protein K8S54_16870 [Spirochaetia bacterium]|nr:hypothetical protein [Spirochaetia bacterium]
MEIKHSRNQTIVLALALLLFIVALVRIGPANTYTSDNFFKYLQAVSLAKAHFQSEELYYPGRVFDPELKAFPFRFPYLIESKGSQIGTYPVMLSAIMAGPVAYLPAAAIPFICLGFALFTLFLFWKLFQPTAATLTYAAFATPLVALGMELSEHPFLLLSSLGGLYFFRRSLSSENLIDPLLAGILSVVGIWLRLEAILYTVSLLGAWIVVTWRTPRLKGYAMFGAGSGVIICIFLCFNFLHYGHLFGPRFLGNPGSFDGDLQNHLNRLVSLAFGGKFKLGQFGYSPLLLLPAVYFLFRRSTDELRILALFVVGFVVAAGISAPNDGVANWGSRYLYLSLYPALILLDQFYREQVQNLSRLRRMAYFALFAYSVLITFIGIVIQKRASSELKAFQTELNRTEGDLVIFPSQLLASYSGQYYFKKPLLVVRSPELAIDLIRSISSRGPRRISFIEYTGWTAAPAAQELEAEFGKDKMPEYLRVLQALEQTGVNRFERITIHEFKTK